MTQFSRRQIISGTVAISLGLAATAFGQTAAPAPDAVVREFYDTLLGSMRRAKELGFAGRYALLDPAVRKAFDLAAMTRISIGPQWRQIDPAVQAKLQSSFAEWTIATYADQFNGYDGEVFAVGSTTDSPPNDKLVETTLTPKGAEAIILNYLMRNTGSGWRIIDVYLTGSISELATRRSEFTAIIKAEGAEGVARALTKRTEDMRAKAVTK
jgi:phospholipid transport system substrate-binding protein